MLNKTQIVELCNQYGLAPSRALGQNFLVDGQFAQKIVRRAAVKADDNVVEIGPGFGSLTVNLAESANSVVAVEFDKYILDPLAKVLSDSGVDQKVRIVHGDAMQTDWEELLDGVPHRLIANLPYNISVPLILDILEKHPIITDLFVMVQKEVALRLAAGPGTKDYGIPSILLKYFASAELTDNVPPSVFHPQPNVDSALLRINRHSDGDIGSVETYQMLKQLVKAGFGKRRKMLRQSIKPYLSEDQIDSCDNVKATQRAEELELDQWLELVKLVKLIPKSGKF